MCFFKKFRAKRKADKLAKLEFEQKSILKEEQPVVTKPNEGVKASVVEEKPKDIPKAKPADVKPKILDKSLSKVEKKGPEKYHVSQNKDKKSKYFKQWRVRKEGSNKTIKYHKTQLEAIDHAEHLAEQAGSSIVIHKVDGTMRKQDYSK